MATDWQILKQRANTGITFRAVLNSLLTMLGILHDTDVPALSGRMTTVEATTAAASWFYGETLPSTGYKFALINTGANKGKRYFRDADGVWVLWFTDSQPPLDARDGGNFQAKTVAGGAIYPVGMEVSFACANAPSGFLPEIGAEISRTTYADLWAFAQTSGILKTEAEWQAIWGAGLPCGFFSSGNGTTTFRTPDWRGAFIRGWDNGRGIDVNRVIGSSQSDANKSHSHNVTVSTSNNSGGLYATWFSAEIASVQPNTHITSSSGGAEAVPKNIARIMFIKY